MRHQGNNIRKPGLVCEQTFLSLYYDNNLSSIFGQFMLQYFITILTLWVNYQHYIRVIL